MLKYPRPPKTKAVRQLTCVACTEPFTVAEELRPGNKPGQTWRMPSDHHPATIMRHRHDPTQRAVTPQARAQPIENQDHFLQYSQFSHAHVNCPRCGADNRNWLQMQSKNPLLVFWPVWIGIAVVFAFAAFTAYSYLHFGGGEVTAAKQGEAFLLGLMIVVTGITTVFITVGTWNAVRLWYAQRSIEKKRSWSEKINPAWLPGTMTIFIMAVIVPFGALVILPMGVNSMFAALDPPPPSSVNEKLSSTKDFLTQLSNEPALSDYKEDVDTLNAGLPDFIDGETSSVNVYEDRWQPYQINTMLFMAWMVNAIIGGVIALAVAGLVVNEAASSINAQLPKPIGYSVANMTRVVVWEAKRSLEVPGTTGQIQWVGVVRNKITGGIELKGICRDHVDDGDDYDPGKAVRAQKYVITSDLNGYIIDVTVTDEKAPLIPRPNYTAYENRTLSEEFFDLPLERRRFPTFP